MYTVRSIISTQINKANKISLSRKYKRNQIKMKTHQVVVFVLVTSYLQLTVVSILASFFSSHLNPSFFEVITAKFTPAYIANGQGIF